MKYSAVQPYNDSHLESLINALTPDEITDFFSDPNHLIYKSHVSKAVLLFTYALNQLDKTPDSENRESHVLTGDYYFSEFYSALSRHGEMEVVHDMVEISKDLSSKKSKQFEQKKILSDDEIKYLLFAPLLYLIDNGYVSPDLNNILDFIIKDLDYDKLPYIINTKGER